MAAPGLPIQELWDEVIDSIHDSTVDLKSTSLVCRSFVARAQSHIFRQIALFATKAPRTTGDMAARLRNLMAFSPHLISHVQVLYLPTADEETLISVTDIRWSHVHSVVLGFSRPTLLSPGMATLRSLLREIPQLSHLTATVDARFTLSGNQLTTAPHIKSLILHGPGLECLTLPGLGRLEMGLVPQFPVLAAFLKPSAYVLDHLALRLGNAPE
ncbi:hypothetical protein B0H13DRAFT_2462637 [Mycena leptocephala]|nr:hypothetical protein B0H13DRAFT_2462637 [Mycena leptocephala]